MAAPADAKPHCNDTGPEVRCNGCVFFYITHDATFPYGCRAMNFKSRQLPSREVFMASGQPCLLFSARPRGA